MPEFFDDFEMPSYLVHQPDVYPLAAHLARRYGCRYIIDIGCGSASKLSSLWPEFDVVGIDLPSTIQRCQDRYTFGHWISHDLEARRPFRLPVSLVRNSLLICSDVIEHMKDPRPLLSLLRAFLTLAPTAIITTPERDLVRGQSDRGPPENPAHVREWNRSEFGRLLTWAGIAPRFLGLTMNQTEALQKRTILAICEGGRIPPPARAPSDFKVLAIVTAFNERDVIEAVIVKLINANINVHVIDNWSTDGTYDALHKLSEASRPRALTVERFPATGPTGVYEWKRILRRVEEIAAESDADWIIHHDADEVREAPWKGLTLRDGLYHAQLRGYNAVDFTVLVFHPCTGTQWATGDPERSMRSFEFGTNPGHLIEVKAWRNLGRRVDLASSGGHDVLFDDRRVEPYNFLLKHYPIRSTEHGIRKIFEERRPRWDPREREVGMHMQYDDVHEDHDFERDPAELLSWDDDFYSSFLAERLSRVGILRPTKILKSGSKQPE